MVLLEILIGIVIFIVLYATNFKFFYTINSFCMKLFVIKNGSKKLHDDTGELNIRVIETLLINTNPNTFGTADHSKYTLEQRERYFNWKLMGYSYRWNAIMMTGNKENIIEMYNTIKSTKTKSYVTS